MNHFCIGMNYSGSWLWTNNNATTENLCEKCKILAHLD